MDAGDQHKNVSNDVPAKATPNLLHVQGLRASVGKFPPMASDRDAKCLSVWCTAGVHQLKIQSNDVRTLCPTWKDIGNFGIHVHES